MKSVPSDEEATDERGTEKRLARAGCHLKQEFAPAGIVVALRDLIQRLNLVAAKVEVRAKSPEIVRTYSFRLKRERRLKVLEPHSL